MPGRLFKITAKRKGERLSEGRRLIKGGGGGTSQVFLSKKCSFESAKSFLET